MNEDWERLPWEPPSEADEVELEICPTCLVQAEIRNCKVICPKCHTILLNCNGD